MPRRYFAVLPCQALAQQSPPYPSAASQGFFWWEFDLTYWMLRMWQALGLIWDFRRPPADVLAGPLATDIKPAILHRPV